MRSCDVGKDSGILRNCIHYMFRMIAMAAMKARCAGLKANN